MNSRRVALLGVAAVVFGVVVAPAASQAAPVVVSTGPSVAVRIDPSVSSIAKLDDALGTEIVDVLDGLPGTYLLASRNGVDPTSVAAAAAGQPGVLWAEPDGITDVPEVQAERIYRWSASDPLVANSQYSGTVLGLDAVHARAEGAGTVVAVIDSGVELIPSPHPALASTTSTVGADFVDGDGVPDDEADGIDNDGNGLIDEGAGHGTHIAGIVHQVAPLATILPIRVLDSDGNGTEWNVARGMLWAAEHHADVVNLSLGKHGSANLLKDATQALVDRGIVVAAAAGNDGKARNEFPAASRCAIAVTGTSSADTVSSFATRGSWVDVGAPAEDITSTFPFFSTGYASWTGTSMASPFVAGEAALLRGIDPSLSVGDTMAYVQGVAVAYTAPASASGRGRIAPLLALDALARHARPDPNTIGVDPRCTAPTAP